MKKLMIFIVAMLCFEACSLRNVAKYSFYELQYKGDYKTCKNLEKIYFHQSEALLLANSKEFMVFDVNGVQRSVNGARFISRPNEMLNKMTIEAVNKNCVFEPIFTRGRVDTELKTKLLDFYISGDTAKISLSYELINTDKIIKSGIISKSNFVKDPSAQTIYNTLNFTMNEAINEMIRRLK